jgi:arylsulfatase A-like enzyme
MMPRIGVRGVARAISTRFRAFLSVLLVAMAAGLTAISSAAAASVQNVVLIILDDQNIWPSSDGQPSDLYAGTLSTPNLDALMNRGHVFTNALTDVSYCSPSRAAFLSGQSPFETRVFHNFSTWQNLLVPSRTLPGYLKSSGLRVGLFGKVFHQDLKPAFKAAVSDAYLRNTANWENTYGNSYDAGPGPYADSQHGDYINTTAAINFIKQNSNVPFFVSLGLYKPHGPWVVPKAYFDKYPLANVVLPKSVPDDLDDIPPYIVNEFKGRHREFLNCEASDCLRRKVQGYLASTSFADTMIGRVTQALVANGVQGKTAIVVIGDNGYHLGEKTLLHKFTLWDEAIRVSLIIVDPSRPDPATVPGVVQLQDIYPTILDLLGKPTPSLVGAKSLLPQLDDPTALTGPRISSRLDSLLVRTREYSYMRHPDGSEEFYDLVKDPYEITNLQFHPQKPELAGIAKDYAVKHNLFLSDAGGQSIAGTAGNDTLSGGHKVTLAGGAGNDTYFLHTSGIAVIETAGGGTDEVYVNGSYDLPPNVENLMIEGTAQGVVLRGNPLRNYIEIRNSGVTVYDGGGLDTIMTAVDVARTIYVLTKGDNAADIIRGFSGTQGARIDLSQFGLGSTCSFSNGVLTVNGEAAAKITGAFSLSRDVIHGCGAAKTVNAATAPFVPSSASEADD